ncbi:HNH endonuclease [Vibrio europaeus]|uniref:HNH endonuclease n=1 Tax=Vibrio europaeus TaxID=300876 RepID=A0AAE7DX06_9VIBR|nr:HNH endonuclease [Vibrio europaeus]MDC5806834.1 HNH endonuclease [Vibrio europaeus]MDC5809431.1 HNH endonuclease [Vibrio europaeus]MDC5827359.1 HNH endonuclease [Vibrio europaeus]MDC5830203.1 HNH endonuclease [Vibrio europaeus]MDC5837059.1 HNH endonuclease [Vibrio europaeus]
METCIICVGEHPITQSNPLTIEHIVPENIGGCLTAKNVCKHCNSKMGSGFEARASKNLTFQLPRYVGKIEGKNGSIPNPFIHRGEKEELGGKYVVQEDLSVKTVPQINLREDDDGQVVEIVVDKSEPHKAREMLKTRLKRQVKAEHGVSLSDEQLDELSDKVLNSACVTTRRVEQPQLQMTHEIDEIATQLVYLKVGYELAVYHFGIEYLKDSQANLLQACLYTQHVPDTLYLSAPPLAVFGGSYGEQCHLVRFEGHACYISLFGKTYAFEFSASKAFSANPAVQYEFNYLERECSLVNLT